MYGKSVCWNKGGPTTQSCGWYDISSPEQVADFLEDADDDIFEGAEVMGVCKKSVEALGVEMQVTMVADAVPTTDQVENLKEVVVDQLDIDQSSLEDVSVVSYA